MPTAQRLLAAAALAAALAAPGAPRAESAVSCHCYRDRKFELARPAAADPYILATARSSLLSAAYGVPKADLVRTSMSGTSADDLWITFWAAARAQRRYPAVLVDKEERGSWKAALAGAPGLGPEFDAALEAGKPDAALAAIAVDDVLVARLGADPATVRSFRAEGASSAETVLAVVLARHLEVPTLPLLRHVRAGKTTWGKLLHESKLSPQDLDPLVRKLVR
jgi:hypothetical protein